MQKIVDWAKNNEEKIKEYVRNRDYTRLLNAYYEATGYSLNKAAAVFKCSRRAFARYLSGERLVPMYIVKIMLQEMQICNVEKNPKDELTKTNASNPHEKQESEKESEFKSKIKYCETTEINKDDSVNLRSPSCALRSGNEEQRSELSPSPQGLTNDDEVVVQSVDGVSDSTYTSINLRTDRQPNCSGSDCLQHSSPDGKPGRGLPSIDDCKNEEDVKTTMEKDDDGRFIWYGKQENDVLFNSIYAYRTLKFHQTRFQAACELNIQESILYEYESGKKKITYTDIQKILTVYHLKLKELFPSLVSYDGDKTFLPLRQVYNLTIDGKAYSLAEEGLYVTDDGDAVSANMWPSFPIQRYDSTGRQLLKYMPDELTIDEYVNSEELIFMKDDMIHFYEKDTKVLKLPPNYLPLLGLRKEKREKVKYIGYNKILTDMELNSNNYTVTFRSNTRKITFDLSSYVFSDSQWYSMLQDTEYFKKGKLVFVGDEISQNQCIIWPDGQYIRIIELYLEKYPYKNFAHPCAYGANERYDNWTVYSS